jgi:hypothetical protein
VDHSLVLFAADLQGSSVIAPRPDMSQVSCHEDQSVNPGGRDQAGVIDVLLALAQKLAPKIGHFACDRQDTIPESV